MGEFELQKIAELEKEIEKWRQQQKEDYTTYLQKVEELQKTIVDSEVIFERNNAFTHKRILELEDKIERAKRILNDFVIQFDFGGSITSQRALINEARSILVLNQEKKEPYCFGKFDKKCEDCQSYCMYRGACEKSSVANGELKREG